MLFNLHLREELSSLHRDFNGGKMLLIDLKNKTERKEK